MWLVVGLGNPGPRYEDTRHNAGFLTVDEIARRWRLPGWRAQLGAQVTRGDVAGAPVLLAQPQGYMNCSGRPAGALLRFYKLGLDRMVVVHDDLDLAFGDVRVKEGGGHGGHNGLKDLHAQLGPDFVRVRVGISRPPPGWDSAEYVLSRWNDDERGGLPVVVAQAADAVECVVRDGATTAMNRFNVRPRERAPRAAADPAPASDAPAPGAGTPPPGGVGRA